MKENQLSLVVLSETAGILWVSDNDILIPKTFINPELSSDQYFIGRTAIFFLFVAACLYNNSDNNNNNSNNNNDNIYIYI